MTNELIKQNDFDLAIGQVNSIQQLATLLLKTPHYKKMGEEGIYSILFACKSLGVDPFQGLNGAFYCLNGKVGMSTELMACLIRRAGHSVQQQSEHNTDIICTIVGKRKDTNDTLTVSFAWHDAITAGLSTKDIWKKYPKVMLYNRAMAILARQLFPDVIKGYGYSEDEIKEIAESKAITVKPVDNDVKPLYLDEEKTQPYMPVPHIVKPLDNDPNVQRINDNCTVTAGKGIVLNCIASKENVDTLLALLLKCPPTFQDNFWDITLKNYGDVFKMTASYCQKCTEKALALSGGSPCQS